MSCPRTVSMRYYSKLQMSLFVCSERTRPDELRRFGEENTGGDGTVSCAVCADQIGRGAHGGDRCSNGCAASSERSGFRGLGVLPSTSILCKCLCCCIACRFLSHRFSCLHKSPFSLERPRSLQSLPLYGMLCIQEPIRAGDFVTAQKKRDILTGGIVTLLIVCAVAARVITRGHRDAVYFLPVSLLRCLIYIGLMTWWGVSLWQRIV